MMKWGRKKPSSSSSTTTTSSNSSSHPHLISHVFPLSWLSKFKQASEKRSARGTKNTHKDMKQDHPLRPLSPRFSEYSKDRRLYTQDNDGFWRLSNGCDQKFVVPEPYWRNCKTNVKEVATKKRSEKGENRTQVADEETREDHRGKVCREVAKEEVLQRTYRRIMEATEELHRGLDEVNEYRKSVEKEMSEMELVQVMQMLGKAEERPPCSDTSRRQKSVLDRVSESENVAKSEWRQLKDAKIREVISKNEKNQRKSFHISRETQARVVSGQSKVRVRSPRTPSKTETCRIKALEDMKKAKVKKKIKEIQEEGKAAAALGSFAVVKCSHDPQQDFRDSMVEMILEKRITRPEELEELLACYLTLNADEYHDLIVKVFKQVWCEFEHC